MIIREGLIAQVTFDQSLEDLQIVGETDFRLGIQPSWPQASHL